MRITYFVHNLNDPAVAKRVAMFRKAGLSVLLVGFWRDHAPPREIAGAPAVGLGETFDAALAHRTFASFRHAWFPPRLPCGSGVSNVIVARNLEMLAIALSARRRIGAATVVYEVLDIHRLMLSGGIVGRSLRALERAMLRRVGLVVTSSPAFVSEYFAPIQRWLGAPPIALVENKTFLLEEPARSAESAELAPAPPWRIGWFGMIRCRRSLKALAGLAARRPDLLEVQIHGRPTRDIAADLERLAPQPGNLQFHGRYRPDELESLYRQVHLNWAVDYFEDEGNSRWLLPNRIYEGGRFDAVTIARAQTETARWLSGRGLGVVLAEPERDLESFLDSLTPLRFERLKAAARAAPRNAFITDEADCQRLKQLLTTAAAASRRQRARDRHGERIPSGEAG